MAYSRNGGCRLSGRREHRTSGKRGRAPARAPPAPTGAGMGDFSGFLQSALKDGIGTMKQGEAMAGRQVAGKADIVDVVSAVNQAEITLRYRGGRARTRSCRPTKVHHEHADLAQSPRALMLRPFVELRAQHEGLAPVPILSLSKDGNISNTRNFSFQ